MYLPKQGGLIDGSLADLEKHLQQDDPDIFLAVGMIVHPITGRTVEQKLEVWRHVDGTERYVAAYDRHEIPTIRENLRQLRNQDVKDVIQRLDNADAKREAESARQFREIHEAIVDNIRHIHRGNRRYTVVPERDPAL